MRSSPRPSAEPSLSVRAARARASLQALALTVTMSWCFPAFAQAGPAVIEGPLVNPANGNTYYLLGQASWTASEAAAVALGGHLATINDAAENQWVYDTFTQSGTVERSLWLGINDAAVAGTFVWSSGQASGYTNFSAGQPNNYGTGEQYAHMWSPGFVSAYGFPAATWNDYVDGVVVDGSSPLHGVVEVDSAPSPNGRACLANTDCASGFCNEQVCTDAECAPRNVVTGQAGPYGVTVDADYLYWVNVDAGTIKRANKDGSEVVDIATGLPNLRGIAVDSTYIYWSTYTSGQIYRALKNGCSPHELLHSGESGAFALTVADGYLWWTIFTANPGTGAVRRAPVAGGTPATVLADMVDRLGGITVDGNVLYLTHADDPGTRFTGYVARYDLTTGASQSLASGLDYPVFVQRDGQYLYWANGGDGRVMRVLLDGSGQAQVLAQGTATYGAVVDETFLYYTDYSARTLTRVLKPGAACVSPRVPAAISCGAIGSPCASNAQCQSGRCSGGACTLDLCVGVACAALDQCHDIGVCNPDSGVCSTPPKRHGVPVLLAPGWSNAGGPLLRVDVETGAASAWGGVSAEGLARGAEVVGVGPGGDYFVGSRDDRTLRRYDRVTGAYKGIALSDVDCEGIAYGADGYLYVSDYSSHRILRFIPGQTPEVFATGIDHPTHLRFGPDGRLYVPELMNAAIKVLDATGGVVQTLTGNLGIRTFSLAFAANGDLWVGDYGDYALRRLPAGSAGPFIVEYAHSNRIYGITIDPNGRIYFATASVVSAQSELWRYDPTTRASARVDAGLPYPVYDVLAAVADSACDDGDPNTVGDVCRAGVCVGTSRCAGVVCSALNQCHHAGVCNPTTGVCSNPAKADGASCDDGSGATIDDQCVGGACVGVNPCSVNHGGCDLLVSCTATPGGRVCGPCPQGYSGTGETGCVDTDGCVGNPCGAYGTCLDHAAPQAGYTCQCVPGYQVSGGTCVDVDECQSGATCPSGATCVNDPGGYHCACASGFILENGACVPAHALVTIDARALSARHIYVQGKTPYTLSSTPLTVDLPMGTYTLREAGDNNGVDFSVDGQGRLVLLPGTESFLEIIGNTLKVNPFPIAVDATELSARAVRITNENDWQFGYGLNTAPSMAWVIPGAYRFNENGNNNEFGYTVDAQGKMFYAAEYQYDATAGTGFLSGAGTSMIKIHPYTVTVDGRALSARAYRIANENDWQSGYLPTTVAITANVIPGNYMVNENGMNNGFAFTVSVLGAVGYAPEFEWNPGGGTGFLSRQGRTITIHPFTIFVDSRPLSASQARITNENDWQAGYPLNTQVQSARLIPGDYVFNENGANNGFGFSVDNRGAISYSATYELSIGGFLSRPEPDTMVVHGYPVSVCAQTLNAANVRIANESGYTPRDTPVRVRLIPGGYTFNENGANNGFQLSVGLGGGVAVDASLTPGGVVTGSGTSSLNVRGLAIEVDATALGAGSFRVDNELSAASTATVATVYLIPGGYHFVGPGADFYFTVNSDSVVSPDARVAMRVVPNTSTLRCDPCSVGNGGCAQTCSSSGDTVSCACGDGYLLGSDGKSCVRAPCPANASGAPSCVCNVGFGGTPSWNGSGWSGTCLPLNQPPVARCADRVVDAPESACGAEGSIDEGSFDPDANDSIMGTQSPAGPYPVGSTVVTLTVTDAGGLSASCTATVTVRDVTPPVMVCGNTQVVECSGAETLVTVAAPTAYDACDGDIAVDGVTATYPLGETTVRFEASDSAAPVPNSASCATTVRVVDTVAPSITCGAPVKVSCAPASGAPAEMVKLPAPTAVDLCDPAPRVEAIDAPSVYPVGVTQVTFVATDHFGNSARCQTEVLVEASAPTEIVAKRVRLWPPNHKYVTVDLTQCIAAVANSCGGETPEDVAGRARVIRYGADEVEYGTGCGAGNTRCDLVPLSNRTFKARAERNGTGNGRVYTIEYAYTNTSGMETQASCEIEVPHDPTRPAVKGDYAWTRTMEDTTCSETCGSALVLTPQDFAAWGTSGTALRVFVGRTEVAAQGGRFVIPLKDAAGDWLKDDVDATRPAALGLPAGAYFVKRRGDGTVVQGLWGFMRAGKTYTRLTSLVEGGVFASLRNFGRARFEGQGNGRAVKGRAGEDEYTKVAPNEVLVDSTVTTHADFFVARVACAGSSGGGDDGHDDDED